MIISYNTPYHLFISFLYQYGLYENSEYQVSM